MTPQAIFPDASEALAIIQECVATGRYLVLSHFTQRMDQRNLFWADVRAVVDAPEEVKDDGIDEFGRPKWVLVGETTDRLRLGIVVAIGRDERGNLAVFLTAFWDED